MDKETKLNIVKALHAETGCGLMEITKCLDSLIHALKHKPMAVSYTHLDVYKRQVQTPRITEFFIILV